MLWVTFRPQTPYCAFKYYVFITVAFKICLCIRAYGQTRFLFLVRTVQLWIKPYQLNLWSWKFADAKLHIWTNSDSDDIKHEMVTVEGEWGVKDVQTEPSFNRSVHLHRAVIQDVQELKWHTTPFLPVTLKKQSLPRRWTQQMATSCSTPPLLPANGVILTYTECHRAKDSEVPHINNSTPSLSIFSL